MKALIPVSGRGTRLLPITKSLPKELLPVYDRPVIHYIVEEVVDAGIEDVVFVTTKEKAAIEDYFDRSLSLEWYLDQKQQHDLLSEVQRISNMINLIYVKESDPKGLGYSVNRAKCVMCDRFLILLGDVITQPNCSRELIKIPGNALSVQEVPWERVSRYGVVELGKEVSPGVFEIVDLVEKPSRESAPSNLAILGRYVMNTTLFDHIEKTKPGRNNEIQLTDAIKSLLDEEPVYAHIYNGKVYDIGSPDTWLQANLEIAKLRKAY